LAAFFPFLTVTLALFLAAFPAAFFFFAMRCEPPESVGV
jgi:hypothetical protein